MIVITKLIMFGVAVVCAVTLAFIVLDFVTDKVDRAYLKKRNRAPLYVARDKDGTLWLYSCKPIRGYTQFYCRYNERIFSLSCKTERFGVKKKDYDYLKWEDEPVEVFLKLEN